METSLKNRIKKEDTIYLIFIILGLLVVLINRIINGFDDILWIVDLSSIFGILYIIFLAKHSILGLYFCLISSSILVFTNIYQHIYFNALICLCVSIPSNIIGIVNWNKNKEKENGNLNFLSKKNKIFMFLSYLIVGLVFCVILYFLKSNLFYLDAFYSGGCAVGLILSSMIYADQFLVYIIADSFGIAMYIILTLSNLNNISYIFTSIVYILISLNGYLYWKKLLKKGEQNGI